MLGYSSDFIRQLFASLVFLFVTDFERNDQKVDLVENLREKF